MSKFCHSCGQELENDATTCHQCNEPVIAPPQYTAPAQAPEAQTVYAAQTEPVPQKPKVLPKIVFPVISVILIAAAALLIMMTMQSSPQAVLAKAMNGLADEVQQRALGSPLSAFPVLLDILNDGTFNAAVTMDNEYYAEHTAVGLTLQSDIEKRDFAMSMDYSTEYSYWDEPVSHSFDAEAYINKTRAAFGVSELQNGQLFGITYSTFERDLDDLDISDDMKDILISAVNALDEALNSSANNDSYTDIYTDELVTFMKDVQMEKIESDIVITLTEKDIASLLKTYVRMLNNDESIQSMRDTFADIDDFDYMMDEMFESLDDAIDMFEDDIEAEIVLTFTIGKGGRLDKLVVDADVRVDGDRGSLKLTADFGESITDKWKIGLTVDNEKVFDFSWSFSNDGDYVNKITVEAGYNEASANIRWDKENGDFKLTLSDGYDDYVLNGECVVGNDSVLFELNEIEGLSVEFTAVKGSKIGNPSFINLDRWDEELTDAIENTLY